MSIVSPGAVEQCYACADFFLLRSASLPIDRLEALGQTVGSAVGAAPKGSTQSPTAACAATLLAATVEVVRKYGTDVRTVLAADVAEVEAADALERQGCLAAIEALSQFRMGKVACHDHRTGE